MLRGFVLYMYYALSLIGALLVSSFADATKLYPWMFLAGLVWQILPEVPVILKLGRWVTWDDKFVLQGAVLLNLVTYSTIGVLFYVLKMWPEPLASLGILIPFLFCFQGAFRKSFLVPYVD